jgi:hypothetical protein
MPQNSEIALPKTIHRTLRPFRYLGIPPQDRERVHLVRERVKCGKPSCRCAHGLRHGPYTFLRYRYWDGDAGDLSITGLQFFEQPHVLDSYHGLEQKFTEITVFVDSLARKARLN